MRQGALTAKITMFCLVVTSRESHADTKFSEQHAVSGAQVRESAASASTRMAVQLERRKRQTFGKRGETAGRTQALNKISFRFTRKIPQSGQFSPSVRLGNCCQEIITSFCTAKATDAHRSFAAVKPTLHGTWTSHV